MVFETQQTERTALHGFEITGAEQRHTERCATKQDQEKRGKRIETEMQRQIRQTERQYGDAGNLAERPQTGFGQRQRSDCSERKNNIGDVMRVALKRQPHQPQYQPQHDNRARNI